MQNDNIDRLSARVVIPLRRDAAFGPRPRKLNPLVEVAGGALVLDTAAIGAMPLGQLRRPVGDLRGARAQIREALDTWLGTR